MATRAATRAAAQGRVTRSGRVPQELIDAELTKALSIKDRRLGSIGPSVNVQEARRRLGDPETAAGLPGTNLCRYAGDDAKVAGKRPSYFNEKTIGRYGMQLCGKNIAEAWSDPEFLQQQKLVCGEKKEWVFPYKRGGKTVKGHCRNLHAARPRAPTDTALHTHKQYDCRMSGRKYRRTQWVEKEGTIGIRSLPVQPPGTSSPAALKMVGITSCSPTGLLHTTCAGRRHAATRGPQPHD